MKKTLTKTFTKVLFNYFKNYTIIRDKNPNICMNCKDEYYKSSPLRYEKWLKIGLCSQCFEFKECFDHTLVKMYSSYGYSSEYIRSKGLPLLRGISTFGDLIEAKNEDNFEIIWLEEYLKLLNQKENNDFNNIGIFNSLTTPSNTSFTFKNKQDFDDYLSRLKTHLESNKVKYNLIKYKKLSEKELFVEEIFDIIERISINQFYEDMAPILESYVSDLDEIEINENNNLKMLFFILDWISNFYKNEFTQHCNAVIITGYTLNSEFLDSLEGKLLTNILRTCRLTASGIIFIDYLPEYIPLHTNMQDKGM
jgi:hypothetical protein